MKPSLTDLDALLDEVLDLEPEQRAAHVERRIADAPTRQRMLGLLNALNTDSFLDQPAAALLDPELKPKRTILLGRYQLLELIGEGGSSTVWLAERVDGTVEQRFAIKYLKAGLASTDQRRRFIAEQKILARLEHPHIARLIDAGFDEHTVPFIVMEYIEGQSITRFAKTLTLDERLKLFIDALSAVSFAHQNLIVHRDIKPANILVDARGTVKLLDFGIAKLLEDHARTHTTQRALTPDYAAPEQFRGEATTTATDVFALGAVLFELLSGCKFRSGTGLSSTMPLKEIVAPSRVLKKLDERERAPLSLLGLSPAKLKGDLDAIVRKALHPEPDRRYASVAIFSDDLRRYMASLPISAQPDSMAYQITRFVQRHRVAVGFALISSTILLAGVLATLNQAERARVEAARARAVQNFLLAIFDAAEPGPQANTVLASRELIERTASELDLNLLSDTAEIRLALGRVYRKLGLSAQAVEQMSRAAEELRGRGSKAQVALGWAQAARSLALLDALKFDEGMRAAEEAIAIFKSNPDFPFGMANALFALGANQGAALKPAAALLSLSAAAELAGSAQVNDFRLEAKSYRERALNQRRSGRLDLAIADVDRALEITRLHKTEAPREYRISLGLSGEMLLRAGKFAQAEERLRDALRESADNELSPNATDMANLSEVLFEQNRLDAALAMRREALKVREAELGAEHPSLGSYWIDMAKILSSQGRMDDAIGAATRAAELYARAYGADDAYRIGMQIDVAMIFGVAGRTAEATLLSQKARRAALGLKGPVSNQLLASALSLEAQLQLQAGNFSAARDLSARALGLKSADAHMAPRALLGLKMVYTESLWRLGDAAAAGAAQDMQATAARFFPGDHPLRASANRLAELALKATAKPATIAR